MVRPERFELEALAGVSEAGARSRNPEPGFQAKDLGMNGAPGEIRTPDLLLRRQSLYPSELRAHTNSFSLHAGLRSINEMHRQTSDLNSDPVPRHHRRGPRGRRRDLRRGRHGRALHRRHARFLDVLR